jgi:hypothetical protein
MNTARRICRVFYHGIHIAATPERSANLGERLTHRRPMRPEPIGHRTSISSFPNHLSPSHHGCDGKRQRRATWIRALYPAFSRVYKQCVHVCGKSNSHGTHEAGGGPDNDNVSWGRRKLETFDKFYEHGLHFNHPDSGE